MGIGLGIRPANADTAVPKEKEEGQCPVHGDKKISTVSAVSRRPSNISTTHIPRRPKQSKISRKESSVSTISRKSIRSIQSNGSTMNE